MTDQASTTTDGAQGATTDVNTTTTDATDNAAASATDDTTKMFDAEYVAKIRQEAASYRTKYQAATTSEAALKAKVDAFETANLSEKEKLEKERNDFAEQAKNLAVLNAKKTLDYEAVVLANKLNIVDPDAAVLLLDRSKIVWDDASGTPTNLQTLMEELLIAKPYLKGQVKPVVPNLGATNGATTGRTDTAGAGVLTLEQVQKMSPKEQMERATEVTAFLKDFKRSK